MQQILYETVAERELEVKVGFARPHLLGELFKGHILKHCCHNHDKLFVAEQTVKHLWQLLRLKGADGIEGF